jgi:aspartyl-tRNA(Asn)/glutamyl-tRNA(Gln) amidotransferase subunit C
MVTEKDVISVASLADITLTREEEALFAHQFTTILRYFDVLDTVSGVEYDRTGDVNVLRDDKVEESLPRELVLSNIPSSEDGYFKAPRVM